MKKRSKPSSKRKSDFLNVCMRVRPPIARELSGEEFQNVIRVNANSLYISEDFPSGSQNIDSMSVKGYSYDRVFGPRAGQKEIYESTGSQAVRSIFEGYNASIIAYGPTGSGKTYTMFQDPTLAKVARNKKSLGIIPRACEEIFNLINKHTNSYKKFLVRVSYLQIYNEEITDLLDPNFKKPAGEDDDPSKKRKDLQPMARSRHDRIPSAFEPKIEKKSVKRNRGREKGKRGRRDNMIYSNNKTRNEDSYLGGKDYSEDNEKDGLLEIRENSKRGIYVDGISEWVVRSPGEIFKLINKGNENRITGATLLNEFSSRSHAVFQIILEQMEERYLDENQKEVKLDQYKEKKKKKDKKFEIVQEYSIGKLNCVDLAGSENVLLSRAKGKRFRETCNINKSLLSLGNVIRALISMSKAKNKGITKTIHVPYRNSKLTRLLKDSLGGNCKTVLIGTCSPSIDAMEETMKTAHFVQQAKLIKNKPYVNKDMNQKALIREYEKELKKLRSELKKKKKNTISKKKNLQIEEMKKRMEKDKKKVMIELEKKSRDYFIASQQKRKLEEKIAELESKLIHVGDVGEKKFSQLLQKERTRVQKEYSHKMNELEKERKTIEEEKAQVDRYKQLLLKQRDIMVALTTRLNDSHETIVELEEEIGASEKHISTLEDGLKEKNKEMKNLRRTILNQIPVECIKKVEDIFELYGVKSENKDKNEISIEKNLLSKKKLENKKLEINNQELEKEIIYKKKLLRKNQYLKDQLNNLSNVENERKQKIQSVNSNLEKKSKAIMGEIYKNIGDFYENDENKDKVIITKSLMVKLQKLVNNSLKEVNNLYI